jgi:quercetin dioxygenase-like cupin family protein
MAMHIPRPTVTGSGGNDPNVIEEFVGRANSRTSAVSLARMKISAGWAGPEQTAEFNEYALVLKGTLRVETRGEAVEVKAGEAVISFRGERVRYSAPDPGGAEYVSVCVPAYSPRAVRRDA